MSTGCKFVMETVFSSFLYYNPESCTVHICQRTWDQLTKPKLAVFVLINININLHKWAKVWKSGRWGKSVYVYVCDLLAVACFGKLCILSPPSHSKHLWVGGRGFWAANFCSGSPVGLSPSLYHLSLSITFLSFLHTISSFKSVGPKKHDKLLIKSGRLVIWTPVTLWNLFLRPVSNMSQSLSQLSYTSAPLNKTKTFPYRHPPRWSNKRSWSHGAQCLQSGIGRRHLWDHHCTVLEPRDGLCQGHPGREPWFETFSKDNSQVQVPPTTAGQKVPMVVDLHGKTDLM